MARILSRRIGLFCLTLAMLGTARPQAQALRTVTASNHGQPVTALAVCGVAVPPPRVATAHVRPRRLLTLPVLRTPGGTTTPRSRNVSP